MRLWEVRDAGEGGTEPWKPEITQHLKLTHTNDTAPLVRRGTDGHARAFYLLAPLWNFTEHHGSRKKLDFCLSSEKLL